MTADPGFPSTPVPTRPFGKVGEYLHQPTVNPRGDDADSSRMGDEGCPNESASVDDATGYSSEEEVELTMGEEVS